MRPDRIIIGECRGGEVLDMLQAMNTGHEGSMTTVHANTPRDALSRIEAMVGMGGIQMSETLIRQTIARSLNVIIQLTRGTDGKRRITSISEITDMQAGVITMQEIFKFEQRGVDAAGQDHRRLQVHRHPARARWIASSATASTPPRSSSRTCEDEAAREVHPHRRRRRSRRSRCWRRSSTRCASSATGSSDELKRRLSEPGRRRAAAASCRAAAQGKLAANPAIDALLRT